MPTIKQRLIAEGCRRRAAARTLDDRLAAIGFGLEAFAEARNRANRIVNRYLPQLPLAHGFYDPHGFRARSIRSGDRFALYQSIESRLLAKIAARDGLLPDAVEMECAA